jgi:hypothetical protein
VSDPDEVGLRAVIDAARRRNKVLWERARRELGPLRNEAQSQVERHRPVGEVRRLWAFLLRRDANLRRFRGLRWSFRCLRLRLRVCWLRLTSFVGR